jgi:hypothetical protein
MDINMRTDRQKDTAFPLCYTFMYFVQILHKIILRIHFSRIRVETALWKHYRLLVPLLCSWNKRFTSPFRSPVWTSSPSQRRTRNRWERRLTYTHTHTHRQTPQNSQPVWPKTKSINSSQTVRHKSNNSTATLDSSRLIAVVSITWKINTLI